MCVIFLSYRTGVEIDQSDFLPAELHQSEVGDTSHTGQVGTALYVAPELNTCLLKAMYNQVSFISYCIWGLFTGHPNKRSVMSLVFLFVFLLYRIRKMTFTIVMNNLSYIPHITSSVIGGINKGLSNKFIKL